MRTQCKHLAYVPLVPCDCLVRAPAAVQPLAADSPEAESAAPQMGQPAAAVVDMAAPRADKGNVAMDGKAAGSTAEL